MIGCRELAYLKRRERNHWRKKLKCENRYCTQRREEREGEVNIISGAGERKRIMG